MRELEGHHAACRRDLRPLWQWQTVVRGNWATTSPASRPTWRRSATRVNTSVNSASRSWTDNNGKKFPLPDCSLANTAANGECGLLNAPLGSLNIAAKCRMPSPAAGACVRKSTRKSRVGVQHEILPRVAFLDFQFTRHAFGNFVASQNTARPPSASRPVLCPAAPTTPPPAASRCQCRTAGLRLPDLNPSFSAVTPFFKSSRRPAASAT